jgi:hypothetical protein
VLANLIDSFSHVQQLLVSLLFLLGISDSSKPIRHLTFRLGIPVKVNADSGGKPNGVPGRR